MLGITIKGIKGEAEKAVREHEKVCERIVAARRQRNARLGLFLQKVARGIELRRERKIAEPSSRDTRRIDGK